MQIQIIKFFKKDIYIYIFNYFYILLFYIIK